MLDIFGVGPSVGSFRSAGPFFMAVIEARSTVQLTVLDIFGVGPSVDLFGSTFFYGAGLGAAVQANRGPRKSVFNLPHTSLPPPFSSSPTPMLRVFLSQPLHLHHHARASSRRNLLTTNSKACHAFHSTPSPTSDAAPPTRPPPDDRGVAGGRGRPKLTSEAITERKALKEEFKPYDSNESGTDWYDQGRSMVCNIVPMFEDNYCFIILVNNGSKIVVDPAEPFVVKNALDRLHTEVPKGLEAIFTTHKHEDHTAGNFTLTNMYNGNFSKGHVFDSETEHQVKVYGPTDDGYISSMTHPVRGGDRFDFGSASGGETIGSLNVEIIDTPFHTLGSISYLCTKTGSPPALFCGTWVWRWCGCCAVAVSVGLGVVARWH